MALPFLTEEFETDPSVIVWISIIFLLTSIGIILTLGSLGDSVGRKRVFLGGFIVFGIGLILAPLSRSLPFLFFGRAVQGIGQAMIVSNGNALLVQSFPDNQRGTALGIENAVVGVGLASGPSIAGLILENWDWQSLFYFRVPFMIIFFVIGFLYLEKDRQSTSQFQFDIYGSISLFITMTCFLLGITFGRNHGWISSWTIIPFSIVPLSFGLFILAESKAKFPVLELKLFRSRLFSFANAANSLQFLSQGAIIILLPFFLLDARNLRPKTAGLILGTLPIVRLIVGPLAGWIADKTESIIITTTGLVIMAFAYFFLAKIGLGTHLGLIVIVLLIEGIGTSIFGPANNSAIMGSVPQRYLGTASGMIATVRQGSMATGIAISGTFYSIFFTEKINALSVQNLSTELIARMSSAHGFQQVLNIMLVTLIIAILLSLLRGKDNPRNIKSF
tara:strand:+ start:20985 stop:22328 length:1344 start_codon:yes stop_codon:yes gene_type:complete